MHTVKKINEAKYYLKTDNPDIYDRLSGHFAARPEGYHFMPAYKMGAWDGYNRFFSGGFFASGLLSELKTKLDGVEVSFNEGIDVDFKDFQKFVESLKIPLNVRDYQIQAAYDACKNQKIAIHLPTSSGKSLVQYIITRFLLSGNKKALIIVPIINLVEQLFKDFVSYGWSDASDYVYKIYGGQKFNVDYPVTISTWQSISKKTDFSVFNALMIDEAHLAKGKSISTIGSSCVNAEWRIGLSGTFPEPNTSDWFSIVGTLGPIKSYANYESLRELGYLANLEIININLDYEKSMREIAYEYCYKNYQAEVDYLIGIKQRNEFLAKLATNFKDNVLVLFTRKKHGKILHDMIKEKGKKVHYIDGGVDTEDREIIRQILEVEEGTKFLEFADIKIQLDFYDEVPLKNGTIKLAKNITLEDDVCEKWIEKYKY